MKIIIGGLYHESNTYNPFMTSVDDFVVTEGEQVLHKVASTKVFIENGFEVVPSIYATALSSGVVTEETYKYFSSKILKAIEDESDIDGIWFHLHGAMTVEHIGSAELQLLKDIREKIGYEIPISLTLDIHGNLHSDLPKYANIIRSYRTVPHTDQGETEEITAQLLVDAIKNKRKVKPAFSRIPLMISGEQALGHTEPLRSIFNKLKEFETLEGIASASYFIGFAWADVEHSSGSAIVIPRDENYVNLAQNLADELARFVYDQRHEFQFEALALHPDEAIERAFETELRPVFISDSGDNTTGGAVGINTLLLDKLMSRKSLNGKKVCVAAIYDSTAYELCNNYNIGDQVDVNVGIHYDDDSKPVNLKGVVKAKGALLGYLGSTEDKVGDVCTISVGDMDIVIANSGESFITMNHFASAGLEINDYDMIVVKQGYLFPELSKISKLDILALTPGATYQLLEQLEFNHVHRPIFPLDQ